jgi:hypothetical protein
MEIESQVAMAVISSVSPYDAEVTGMTNPSISSSYPSIVRDISSFYHGCLLTDSLCEQGKTEKRYGGWCPGKDSYLHLPETALIELRDVVYHCSS